MLNMYILYESSYLPVDVQKMKGSLCKPQNRYFNLQKCRMIEILTIHYDYTD